MKRRFIAAIAAAILTLSCVASVSAAGCPRYDDCPGTLEGYACTMPTLANMPSQSTSKCAKHGDGCTKIIYYAYSKARCTGCGTYDDETLTHACAIGHREGGSVVEAYSCCQYW